MVAAILRDFPDSMQTARLSIEVTKPGDGTEINRAILESFEALHQWIPWARKKPTAEESEISARQAYARWILREEFRFCIRDKNTREFVGVVGIPRLAWDVPRFEIGYWIRSSLAGQGYASEAAQCVVGYAFDVLGAKRVELRCDERNIGSARVACKLGFKLESRLLNHDLDYVTNEPVVTLVFVRIRNSQE